MTRCERRSHAPSRFWSDRQAHARSLTHIRSLATAEKPTIPIVARGSNSPIAIESAATFQNNRPELATSDRPGRERWFQSHRGRLHGRFAADARMRHQRFSSRPPSNSDRAYPPDRWRDNCTRFGDNAIWCKDGRDLRGHDSALCVGLQLSHVRSSAQCGHLSSVARTPTGLVAAIIAPSAYSPRSLRMQPGVRWMSACPDGLASAAAQSLRITSWKSSSLLR